MVGRAVLTRDVPAVMAHLGGASDMAVILVEQHAHRILPLSRHAIILECGRMVHTGPSEALNVDSLVLGRWLDVAERWRVIVTQEAGAARRGIFAVAAVWSRKRAKRVPRRAAIQGVSFTGCA